MNEEQIDRLLYVLDTIQAHLLASVNEQRAANAQQVEIKEALKTLSTLVWMYGAGKTSTYFEEYAQGKHDR